MPLHQETSEHRYWTAAADLSEAPINSQLLVGHAHVYLIQLQHRDAITSTAVKQGFESTLAMSSVNPWQLVAQQAQGLGAQGAKTVHSPDSKESENLKAFEEPWSRRRAPTQQWGPLFYLLMSADNL